MTTSRELFDSHRRLVDQCANQIHRHLVRWVNVEDLCAFGMVGLWQAAERFDPEIGVPFRKFAWLRIRGSIMDEVRQLSCIPRHSRERGKRKTSNVSFLVCGR